MKYLELIRCEPVRRNNTRIYVMGLIIAFLLGFICGEIIYFSFFHAWLGEW